MGKPTEILNKLIKATADREGKCLTFMLFSEEYGIEITKVREIIRMITDHSLRLKPGQCC